MGYLGVMIFLSLFLVLCVVLIVLNVFADFNFASPEHVSRRRF